MFDRTMAKDIFKVAAVAAIIFTVLKVGALVPEYLERIRGAIPLLLPPAQEISQEEEGDNTATSSLPYTVAEGFRLHVFADDIKGVRDITRGPDGRIVASIPQEGEVVALPDRDGDGNADSVQTILSGLQYPHGLATFCRTVSMHNQRQKCFLYVAEENAVTRFPYDFETEIFGDAEQILTLPTGGRHTTRSLQIAPARSLATTSTEDIPITKQRLLTSVGSSCNVCNESDERRAAIISSTPEGEDVRVISGLRNSVFMTLHPVTGDVWATEMGRDGLGDELPPDEINIIKHGNDYGFPFCYGTSTPDTAFDSSAEADGVCNEKTPSHIAVRPAHASPLGIDFVPEEGWKENYWFDAIVALHGSWNRTEPSGYSVVRYELSADGSVVTNGDGEPVVHELITGFKDEGGSVIGRPVDVYLEPGGVGYISDDRAGVIYRLEQKELPR